MHTTGTASDAQPKAGNRSFPAGTSSLMRAFSLLETMASEAQSLTLDELSRRAGVSRAVTERIVATFSAKGYILVEGNLLTLGPRLIHLGATASLHLGAWARPYLDGLVSDTGVTASIAVLDSDEVVYMAHVTSSHTLGMFVTGGERVSPHSTSVGKAILSQLPDQRIRETLTRTGMEAATDRTITQIDAFLEHVALVRRQQYAFEDGEQDVGVRSIAVPVLGAPRVMAVSLSAPESRMSIAEAMSFLPALERTAEAYGNALNEHTVGG